MSDEAIITSSTDQIWRGSVPNPPDDPRPEPPPPPDDVLPACPVCGSVGRRLNIESPRMPIVCDECDLIVPMADWRRLSRAVALLRAVDRIDRDIAAHPNRSLLFWRIPCDTVGHQPELSLSNGQSIRRPLSDALIALAAQLEAVND